MGAWGWWGGMTAPPPLLVATGPADVQNSLRNFSQAHFTPARADFTAWFGPYPAGIRAPPASRPPSSPSAGLWSPVRPSIGPWIGPWTGPWVGLWLTPPFPACPAP